MTSYRYDPYARLSRHKEAWMGLGMMGYDDTPFFMQFRSAAASELLGGMEWTWVRYYMLISAMARGDHRACRMFVNDWGGCRSKEVVNISKFIPGDHFHAMGLQFNTLGAAQRHIRDQNKLPGNLTEKHVYIHEGD